MRQGLRTALMIGLLGVPVAIAGCASSAKSTETTALKCPACKTVWVKTTDRYGADYVVQVQEQPQIVCEYCTKAAAGDVDWNPAGEPCESCGGRLKKCHIRTFYENP